MPLAKARMGRLSPSLERFVSESRAIRSNCCKQAITLKTRSCLPNSHADLIKEEHASSVLLAFSASDQYRGPPSGEAI